MRKNLPAKWDPALFQQLTPLEQAFVMHPEVFTDPVKAARDVGYSESTARARAHVMRKQLMYYIMPQHEKRMDQLGAATVERIVQELEAIAFANESDYYDTIDVDGETIKVLKDVTRMSEPMQRAIKKVHFETVVVGEGEKLMQFQRLISLELYDKMAALRELAEIRGAKDPRFRKPPEEGGEERELLEHLEPEELEELEEMYARAAARAKKKADKKRDAAALPGKVLRKEVTDVEAQQERTPSRPRRTGEVPNRTGGSGFSGPRSKHVQQPSANRAPRRPQAEDSED